MPESAGEKEKTPSNRIGVFLCTGDGLNGDKAPVRNGHWRLGQSSDPRGARTAMPPMGRCIPSAEAGVVSWTPTPDEGGGHGFPQRDP